MSSTPTTSVDATSRPTGSRPGAGPPAARIIVRLRGALDVAAAPALRERLIGILHPGMSLLVLDGSCFDLALPWTKSPMRRHDYPFLGERIKTAVRCLFQFAEIHDGLNV